MTATIYSKPGLPSIDDEAAPFTLGTCSGCASEPAVAVVTKQLRSGEEPQHLRVGRKCLGAGRMGL